MGDNRNDSDDSRDSRIGCIDEDYVLGKAFFSVFPFCTLGPLARRVPGRVPEPVKEDAGGRGLSPGPAPCRFELQTACCGDRPPPRSAGSAGAAAPPA